jgi:hypothetical protein
MDPQRIPCRHKPLTPAIQRCCDARNSLLRELNANQPPDPDQLDPSALSRYGGIGALNFLRSKYDKEGKQRAEAAYCSAMPDPSTRQGVKDFIACVLHGMTIDVFSNNKADMLIRGARVALTGHRSRYQKGVEKENTLGNTENEDQPAA